MRQHRHRRAGLLLFSMSLTGASLAGATFVFATQPPQEPTTTPAPPPPPTEAPTTVPPPTLAPITAAPTELPTTTAAPTTEAATTTEATTTTAPPVVVPSVVFAANAECDPTVGRTTVVWTVTNNGTAPVTITNLTEPVALEPNPVPAFGYATASRVIDGPETDQSVTSTVTIDAGGGNVFQLSDEVTAFACEGPQLPRVAGTFTVTPSVSRANVGETITYEYCGTNTGEVALRFVRMTDDRLGVAFEGNAVVQPGETLCNTDVGEPVSYVVPPDDAGSVISNNAIVTVLTEEAEPREFQATATADVGVPLIERPEPPPPTTTTVAPATTLASPATSTTTLPATTTTEPAPTTTLSATTRAMLQVPANGSVRICHRGGGDNNPYGSLAEPASSILGGSGHVEHDGPIWYPGITVDWGDIIPPFVYYDGRVFEGLNWTAGGQAVWNNDCDARKGQVTIVPENPQVMQGACVDGVVAPPSVQPAETAGITYTLEPPGPFTDITAPTVVTVTATIVDAFRWGPMPSGWTQTSQTTATYRLTLNPGSCIEAIPLGPEVVQASCVGGEVTEPTITPGEAAGITYSYEPPEPWDGTVDTTVVVTATLADGYGWGDLPSGWTETSPTTATFTVELQAKSCAVITPPTPSIIEAACVDGVLTEPTITPVPRDGITYSVDVDPPYAPGDTVEVTATLDNYPDEAWPPQEEMPDGWVITSDTEATFTHTFDDVSCVSASPVDPEVVQASCVNGSLTRPTVVPQPTEGVAYTVAPPAPYDPTANLTVTVTATLGDGFAWVDPLPEGWEPGEPAATTAVFTVELVAASCTPVEPLDPDVVQAECVGGVVTEPSVTAAEGPEGVSYVVAPEGPYDELPVTVTVTATLAETGVSWPTVMPGEWHRIDAVTARYEVTLAAASCTPVEPVDPSVVEAECVGGVVTVPSVTVADGPEGVSYVVSPEEFGPGDTVTVTASLADGFGWVDPLPEGWEPGEPAATTAVFTVELDDVTCTPVEPVDPSVVEAECVGGVVTVPSVTVADGPEGVSYVVSPAEFGPGDTVTVTASLADGFGWVDPLPEGWVAGEPAATTAVFTVELESVSCVPVSPALPSVGQATCTGGVVVAPSISVGPTDGVSYSFDPAEFGDGTADLSVTVTASLADGFGWGPLPEGWTQTSSSTAELTVLLVGTSCEQVVPVAPTVDEAECVGGVVTAPALTAAVTDGISYSFDPAGPYQAGQSVTVTATLDPAGVGWPPQADMPDGWTITSDTEATFEVTFAEVTCTPVSPADPTLNEAVCVDDELTAPTITFPVTPGIVYTAEPAGPYDPTVETEVTVTATVQDGFAWEGSDAAPSGFASPAARGPEQQEPPPVDLPEGWTWVSPTEATFALTIPASPPCPTPTTEPLPETTESTEPAPTTAPTEATVETTVPGTAEVEVATTESETTTSTSTTTTSSTTTFPPTTSTTTVTTTSTTAAVASTVGAATSLPAPTTTLIPPPPGIVFTFTNDPSVPVAAVGDVVAYAYCGVNMSDVPLEVVRVEDDRFGILEVPEDETIVEPGEELCNTDLGLPVTYEVAESDAGTTIVNNAIVTVRTTGAGPQAFQAADVAEVEVRGIPPTGASGLPVQLLIGIVALGSGSLLVVLAGRRRTRHAD